MFQSICRGATAGVVTVFAMAAFATSALAGSPTAVTLPATGVEAHQATLNGTVDPNGVKSAYIFQYGPTKSYGHSTKATAVPIGSTAEAADVVQGLIPGTKYHFRIIGLNANEEVSYGADRTFKTVGRPAFEAAAYPAGITGTASQAFGTKFGEVSCEEASLSGATLVEPSAEVVLVPEYESCEALGFSADIEMNGCKYTFDLDNGGPAYQGSLRLSCASGAKMEVQSTFCTLSFPDQQIATVSYDGSGASVSAEADGDGLVYTGSGSICNGSGSNGSFEGDFQLSAASGGVGVPLVVGGEPSIGLFVSSDEGGSSQLEADEYPVSAVGRASTHLFDFAVGEVSCEEGVLGGTLSSAAATLNLAPQYGGCQAFGASSTVQMQGCTYQFHVANAGPPYDGSVDLSCGAGQMTVVSLFCTVKIPPQTLGAVSYENVGAGNERQVVAEFEAVDFKYTYEGVACGGTGSASDGALSGKTVVEGLH